MEVVRVWISDKLVISTSNSMQPISTLLNHSNKPIQKFIRKRINQSSGWWTPLWRGLIADPHGKHRKAMGSAVWLFLYLLTYANRKTGMVRRKISRIEEDTGYPLRTIQRHLKRLSEQDYITVARIKQYLHIQIKKWKSFKHSTNENQQKL